MLPIRKKGKGIVEVTTFTFASKPPASREIRLSECLLPLREHVPHYFSALHGTTSKNEAIMMARQHAEANNLHMLIANLYLQLPGPILPGVVTPETLEGKSLISMSRISSALIAELAELWKRSLFRDRSFTKEGVELLYKWEQPSSFIADKPAYIEEVFNEWNDALVIAHNAKFTFTEKPVMVATFKPTEELVVGYEVDPGCANMLDTIINDLF